MKKVYEIIDQTNFETYFPLAIFLDFEEAKGTILNWPKSEKISPFSEEEFERVEIKERELGFSENGKTVFTLNRTRVYDEEKDKYFWKSEIQET